MDLGSGNRRAEAAELYKKAMKLTQPSILSLRLQGDWPTATPLFERAGLLYKVRS
jgi:hypothetical protein